MKPKLRGVSRPFRTFHSSPEIIRLVVMIYLRFPLSLLNVKDQLAQREINICHETVGTGGSCSVRCLRLTYGISG